MTAERIATDEPLLVRQVIMEVRERVTCHVLPGQPLMALCLQHAILTVQAIRARGTRAILQAGSASWRYQRPDLDDGIAPTHFSYVWDMQHPASQAAMARGEMPEMHVWAAIPDKDAPAIVDLTTRFWPQQARRLAGLTWTADQPPEYLWGAPPPSARYVPAEAATWLALMFAADLFGADAARALVS